jgi:cellulose synthase operon protein C
LAAVLLCLAPRASAQSVFHPELAKASARLHAAGGPEAYAALRRVWDTWDRADPAQVEEVLLAAEQDPRLAPPVRVYAGLLGAFARTRRGDLRAAREKIRALGYVDRWLVVGPFDNEGRAGLDLELGPEFDFDKAIVAERAYTGKERPVRWREAPPRFPYGFLDTGALVRPDQKICVYATTFVRPAPGSRAPRDVTAWVGTSGSFKLFFNGEAVLSDKAYRDHDADRFATVVRLHPGTNNVTLKLCGDESAPVVSLRIGDAQGAPDPKLVVTATLGDSQSAAELVARLVAGRKAAKPAATARPTAVQGPVQVFEQRIAGKRPSAADEYEYAEYLVRTGGDDPTVHQARDLARRAAEREPTIERLLLAGELAEDRNGQAEWIAKAATLAAKSDREDVDVLLAQADHARGGVNWRDASPFFDRVLAQDPDDVDALRGRVELYNEAGLRRTALATLERALERSPYSVTLLNMTATQLRSLGRTTEAEEVEDRYAARRFDDRSFLASQIELSLARRDRAAVERWVERLLDLDPGSQWALAVAARAHRGLGQPELAIAAWQQSLELAPEDVATLRALADLYGELGATDKQLALLRRVLEIRPQDSEVREYVEHIEPPRARPDEAYAWAPERFLPLRTQPARGQNRRTLRDLTVSTVFQNGLSREFRQVVFQPLTDAAAAEAREYVFAYQADRQTVELRGARVYRKDGRVDEAIEHGTGAADSPEIAMYTSTRTFYVRLPRLEPGDVVELRYRVDDAVAQNEYADYFGDVVYLQSAEPVANAEYVLITPKARAFYVDSKIAGLQQSVRESGDQRIYRFFARSIPAARVEANMPPWNEVLGFVHVSTYRDWKDLGRWYWGLVRDQLDLDDETRKLARDITKGATSDLGKVKRVYDWVVQNTRYVALEFGIYGLKPHRCVQTVARGWGDCKDKATVIVSLLKELGIPASLVIVRTQLRGNFPSELPSFAPYDHVIAYVPSLDLYLDGTAEFSGSSELPKLDLGALAIRVNQGNAERVYLPEGDPAKNVVERRVVATVAKDGHAQLEIEYQTRGVDAAEWRARYHAEATRRERVNTDLGREFPGFTIVAGPTGITTGDLGNLELPVSLRIRGAAETFARREGNQLSVGVTTSLRLVPTYAALAQRTQDLRILGFSTRVDTFVVRLPAGATVDSLPPNAEADGPFGSYSVQAEQQGAQVVVKSRLSIKVSRVTPKDYAAWKRFCAEADQALSARLVVNP